MLKSVFFTIVIWLCAICSISASAADAPIQARFYISGSHKAFDFSSMAPLVERTKRVPDAMLTGADDYDYVQHNRVSVKLRDRSLLEKSLGTVGVELLVQTETVFEASLFQKLMSQSNLSIVFKSKSPIKSQPSTDAAVYSQQSVKLNEVEIITPQGKTLFSDYSNAVLRELSLKKDKSDALAKFEELNTALSRKLYADPDSERASRQQVDALKKTLGELDKEQATEDKVIKSVEVAR